MVIDPDSAQAGICCATVVDAPVARTLSVIAIVFRMFEISGKDLLLAFAEGVYRP